jgi:hypothetical protein
VISPWRREDIREVDVEIVLPMPDRAEPAHDVTEPEPVVTAHLMQEPEPLSDDFGDEEIVWPREPASRRTARGGRPPAPPEQLCEIVFWQGYVKAMFYGRIFGPEGEALAVAESPTFRSHGNGLPEETEAARAAYEVVRQRLIAAGWQHVDKGSAWYADVFRRAG